MKTSMDTTAKIAMSLVLTVGLMLPAVGNAHEVYKWADKAGVVHYSGSLPAEGVTDYSTLEFPSEYERPGSPRAHYRSMLEVAKQLEISRLAREKARARQAALLARQAQQRTQAVALPAYAGGSKVYPFGAFGSGFHPSPFFLPGILLDRLRGSVLPISRGSFVPSVKTRAFFHNPAASARAVGGEAFPLQ